MTPRPCQWCGEAYHSAHPAKLYCSPKCKDAFGNFMAVVGKRIAATTMAWRLARGTKGVGASAMKEMCQLLDEANNEFRDVRPKNAPGITDYYRAVRKPSGIRRGMDR